MKVVSVPEMRAIEQSSVDHGVSLEQLQLQAAEEISQQVARLYGEVPGYRLFLAGAGNNGRDGLIAALLLARQGVAVRAFLAHGVGQRDVVRGLQEEGVPVFQQEEPGDHELLRRWVRSAGLIVDGLLGIGIRGSVREPMAGIIRAADESALASGVPVVAIDLPSGIDADSGAVAGCALHASCTLSLGAVKAGLLRFPAAGYTGKLVCLRIGLPPESYVSAPVDLLDEPLVRTLLPRRSPDSHKGSLGRVLVVGGSEDFVGAPILAGAAAARSGCGLVTLAVPAWQRPAIAALLPEATFLSVGEITRDSLPEVLANVSSIFERCEALVLGPGLGRGQEREALAMGVLEARRQAGVPAVIDADGLTALAAQPRWWGSLGSGCVLTPHPGEMARLTGLDAREIGERRWEVAGEYARRWGQVVVLKGAFSVVAGPDGGLWVNPAATAALATGGTGDVLAGMVAGLMAQGASPVDAARAAVYLHTVAAEEAMATLRADRLLASDLLPAIPRVLGRTARGG